MKIQLFYFFVILAFTLAACGPDPRDAAEAGQITLNAEQNAADHTQARQQAADQYNLKMQEQEATQADRIAARQRLILWSSIALCVVILATGAGVSWTVIGAGQAFALYARQRAELAANLIPLDRVTRQFPLLMRYTGKGRFSLVNPNTGSIALLDTRRVEDRQMIATSGAVQLAGVITQEARKSKDPAGVSVFQPVVIGAKTPGLEVGSDLKSNVLDLETGGGDYE